AVIAYDAGVKRRFSEIEPVKPRPGMITKRDPRLLRPGIVDRFGKPVPKLEVRRFALGDFPQHHVALRVPGRRQRFPLAPEYCVKRVLVGVAKFAAVRGDELERSRERAVFADTIEVDNHDAGIEVALRRTAEAPALRERDRIEMG